MMPLSKAAEALKRKGVEIFPVGFWTKELNVGSLMKIASDETIMFNMDFIPEFLDAMKKISKVKCSGNFRVLNHGMHLKFERHFKYFKHSSSYV